MTQNVYCTVISPKKLFVLSQYPWSDPEVAGDRFSYTVYSADGGIFPILTATVVGTRGVYLEPPGEVTFPVGVQMSVQFDPSLTVLEGVPVSPNPLNFKTPNPKSRVSVSLGSFTGENISPFLGAPAGQIFFSPALENPVSPSTLEVDEITVCVDLVDHYQFPVPVDPKVFFLSGAQQPDPGLIGNTAFTLAGTDPYKYQETLWNFGNLEEDATTAVTDVSAEGLLVENYDPTRVALLNNAYWTLAGDVGVVNPFICADTTAPIPAGSTIGPFPLLWGSR